MTTAPSPRARPQGGAWGLLVSIGLGILLLLGCLPAAAHDTPGDARVHALVKPDGDRLHVLLRVPLGLMLNVDLPKHGPGYLALGQLDEGLARAVQAVDRDIGWYDGDRRLALVDSSARVSIPSDTSFSGFDSAWALIHGPPLPASTYVFWNQGYFDAHLVYRLEAPDTVVAVDFKVAPALRDRVRLDLRFALADGTVRSFDLPTAEGPVLLDPRWYQAAWTFLKSGVEHILKGPDHLLFVLCLVLPFRRVDVYLVGVISAFTVAHSVTLIGAAYGLAPAGAWFTPLVELLIAASILYMAIENVLRPQLRRRWVASAVFGLVHGFGFSFVLQTQLQLAGSNLLLSLLAFNVGVELGQLVALLVVMPALAAWRAALPGAGRAIDVVVCVLAGHVAWHWLIDRLAQYQVVADEGPSLVWLLAATLLTAMVRLAWRAWSARKRPATAPAR